MRLSQNTITGGNDVIDLLSYNFTIKKAGKKLTIKKYDKLNTYNFTIKSIRPVTKGKSNKMKENFLKSLARARQNVFDIISCNVNNIPDYFGNKQMPKFITLTFKDNVTDSKFANLEFTKFNKRLSYYLYGENKNVLKYICIPEFQKRGAIHYHVLYFNLPYIEFENLGHVWGNGFVFVESVKDNIEDYAKYVAKYMNKENSKGEENFDIYLSKGMLNQKRYFTSRGLKRPIVYKLLVEHETYEMIVAYLKDFNIDNYTYENEFIGKVEQLDYEIIDRDVLKTLFETIKELVKDLLKTYNRPIKLKRSDFYPTNEVSPWQI